MAKSKAKLVTASEKVTGLVDRGFEVDVDLKNLGFEDKGIKKILTEEMAESFGDDTTVRVEGNKAAAIISLSEKYVINGDADTIDKVRKAAEQGFLGNAVEVEQVLNIPPSERERAASILQAAGITATTSVSVSVVPAEYRVLVSSPVSSAEIAEAKATLESVTERQVSYRVKYEKL